MSESYVSASSNGPVTDESDQSGKVDTAKQEASGVKDTATEQAKNVAGTAKAEAKSVAGEAKSQVKSLYAQGQRELKDQAGNQQQRVASGLRSASDQLDSMATNSDSGVATDLVRNVGQRIGSAASWLENRDPKDVFDDVKDYARRHTAIFVGGALVLGVVAGRLTRSLVSNARDESSSDNTPDYAGFSGSGATSPSYTTDYTSAGTGYAGTLPADVADTAPSGVYASGASGLGAGGVAAGGLGGSDLDETGIEAVELDVVDTDDLSNQIPGGAANVTGDGLADADTPLYAESVESFGGAGDDDRSDRI